LISKTLTLIAFKQSLSNEGKALEYRLIYLIVSLKCR
jgi:hypothetical protein